MEHSFDPDEFIRRIGQRRIAMSKDDRTSFDPRWSTPISSISVNSIAAVQARDFSPAPGDQIRAPRGLWNVSPWLRGD